MSQQTGPVTITGYEQKTGTGQRGPWTLHKVTASDGNTYDTFDAPTAQKAQQAGSNPVVLVFDARQNGQYTNYTLKDVLPVAGTGQFPAPVQAPVQQAPQQASEKDQKITRLAAQRSAAQLLPSLDFSGEPAGVISGYRKLVEELILHAETGRWATSAPVQAQQEPDDLPWPEQAA